MIQVPAIEELSARLRSGVLDRQQFLEESVRLSCMRVDCSRTGLWIFTGEPGDRRLQCMAMYDRTSDRMVHVEDRSENGAGPYFEELERRSYVLAHDARTHAATKGFFEQDLRGRGVHSLMAVAFSLNGKLHGALTCTQLEAAVHWTPQQLGALIRIGSRISLGLAAASPRQLDTFLGPL